MTTIYNPIAVAATKFTSDTYTGGSVPASFDAALYRPYNRGQLKLTIYLRAKLRQSSPKPIPLQLDASGKPFWTSPWNAPDWQRFIRAAEAQADMWNNKFWLVPPTWFSEFDAVFDTFPNQAWRPTIRCELVVFFNPTDDAHLTIDVVNLNLRALLGQPQDPGTFRSHALLYDSLDAVPWLFPLGPGPNQPTKHYTIAHEIGHAMGLGHIGTILKTPLCELAMLSEKLGIDHLAPAFHGGRDSLSCYGVGQGRAIVGNIMGGGDDFTVDNALPWLWAIGMMRNRPYDLQAWRVVMSDPGEGIWVKR